MKDREEAEGGRLRLRLLGAVRGKPRNSVRKSDLRWPNEGGGVGGSKLA